MERETDRLGRYKTGAWKAIHSMCKLQNLDEKDLYARSKMLLGIYRRVCWSTVTRADYAAEDIICYCGSDLDGALLYLEVFAPEREREHFEDRVKTLFETRWMTELVEDAMIRVKEFPDGGELYFELLSKCYLDRWKYSESDMLELLNMERSRFYDKKKEAGMVFGIALWGNSIPRMKACLHEIHNEMEALPNYG